MEKESSGKKKSLLIGIIGGILLAAAVAAGLLIWNSRSEQVVLYSPAGLLDTEDGWLYVTDMGNNTIVRMMDDTRELAAGYSLPQNLYGESEGGYSDGSAEEALFNQPFALEEWGDGIVVSDSGNNCLRLLTDEGQVRTLAGTTVAGCQNGPAQEATFNAPKGISAGPDDCLYIADSGNGVIRRLNPDGQVDTLVGGMDTPTGLCWDGEILYITDAGTSQILKYEKGQLEVAAGKAWYAEDPLPYGENSEEEQQKDGSAQEAVFASPQGIYVEDGVIYVADSGFSSIRRIWNGQTETLDCFEGTGSESWPGLPIGLTMRKGVLYVADAFSGMVYTLELPDKNETQVTVK